MRLREESKGKVRRVIQIILGEALYLSENGLLSMQEIQSAHEQGNGLKDCENAQTIKCNIRNHNVFFWHLVGEL